MNNKHIGSVTLTHVIKLWKFEFVKIVATISQVGPGYVLLFIQSTFGPMVFLQTLTPLEPFVQKLCHYFYGPRHLAWLVKFSIIGESINVSAILSCLRVVTNPPFCRSLEILWSGITSSSFTTLCCQRRTNKSNCLELGTASSTRRTAKAFLMQLTATT